MSKIVDVSDRFKNNQPGNITFNHTDGFIKKKEFVEDLYILQNLVLEGKITNVDCIFDYEGETYVLTSRREEKIKREDIVNRICKCPEIYRAVFKTF